MLSRVNEVNGENLQDPPIKNPGYANGLGHAPTKPITGHLICVLLSNYFDLLLRLDFGLTAIFEVNCRRPVKNSCI